MSFFDSQLLNLAIFLPLLFAALVAILPGNEKGQLRVAAFIGMAVEFLVTIAVYFKFNPGGGSEFQLEYRTRWISDLGISYHTGVDGLAVSLVLLTGFLGPLAVLASWKYIQDRVKEFHIALLILQTAMIGALCSLDIILFYVFWEAMLVPMYLLIGVWGSEERQMAATKFFLYTLAGSLLMLVAILSVYFLGQPPGARSFDYATMYNSLLGATQELSSCLHAGGVACTNLSPLALALKSWGPWMFLAFALSFAIKVPMFPLHTWLPDAHTQAPVAGSIILAGVLLKMGTFGFWRYAIPLFPEVARMMRPYFMGLAVVGIIYGALMCLAQRDIKRLIAYSSVSHLGYCMLGMFAITLEGASGSAYQMLNHGVSTGALFFLFGVIYERRHTRLISDYGGIAKVMPVYAACFVIITFSSVAVPGTNGFVGEFLVLLGTFKSGAGLAFGVLGALGVILGAIYMLRMVQRVFFGQITLRENLGLTDLSWREGLIAAPFVLVVLVMGLAPQPFLDRLHASTDMFVKRASFAAADSHLTPEMVRMKVMALPPEEGVAQALPVPPAHVPPAALAARR